ncbi:MAG: hypothetical protein NTV68_03105 [Methanomicrobiales archaeon]|nr:hypothetical protein [Methanomicrobiales archaeon]
MRKKWITLLVVLLALLAGTQAVSAVRPTAVGGNQGWYEVMCNVDGATVLFDSQNVGQIQSGVLYVPVYSTGTPYTTYTVQMTGYTPYSGPINSVPGKGEFVTLYATLNPIAPTTPAEPIGGNVGWYVVNCNVNGATVFFDTTNEGQIAQGTLTVQVYVTGTPYKTYSVQMPGYSTFNAPITQYPGKGEKVNLYATLNPSPTAPPAPTTKAPLPAGIIVVAVTVAGLVAAICATKKF